MIALAGNKADMENKRKVQTEEAQQYSADSDIIHMETSAKTAANVGALFIAIGKSESWFRLFLRIKCYLSSNITESKEKLYVTVFYVLRLLFLICIVSVY